MYDYCRGLPLHPRLNLDSGLLTHLHANCVWRKCTTSTLCSTPAPFSFLLKPISAAPPSTRVYFSNIKPEHLCSLQKARNCKSRERQQRRQMNFQVKDCAKPFGLPAAVTLELSGIPWFIDYSVFCGGTADSFSRRNTASMAQLSALVTDPRQTLLTA